MTWYFVGALGGTRTPSLLIRSQMLYPLSYERWTSRQSTATERLAAQFARHVHSGDRASDSFLLAEECQTSAPSTAPSTSTTSGCTSA